MAGPPHPAPPPCAASLLDRAVAYTAGSLHLVTQAMLPNPTPCAGWTLAELLTHMNDSFRSLYEAATLGHVPLPGPQEPLVPEEELVAGLRGAACATLGAWSGAVRSAVVSVGGLPLATEVIAGVGAVEVTLHGWDVARACGQSRPIPGALAADLLRPAHLFVTAEDRPARFAAPHPLPPDACLESHLLAFLGRDPHWTPTTS
jgi:uncharacterized protein (TIGR03086 family)